MQPHLEKLNWRETDDTKKGHHIRLVDARKIARTHVLTRTNKHATVLFRPSLLINNRISSDKSQMIVCGLLASNSLHMQKKQHFATTHAPAILPVISRNIMNLTMIFCDAHLLLMMPSKPALIAASNVIFFNKKIILIAMQSQIYFYFEISFFFKFF